MTNRRIAYRCRWERLGIGVGSHEIRLGFRKLAAYFLMGLSNQSNWTEVQFALWGKSTHFAAQ